MLKKLFAASVILLAMSAYVFADSAPNMREGKWEITTKMEMPGMPMSMPPVKYTQCLTEEDFVPQNSQSGEECKISEMKVEDDTVTWTMECKSPNGEMKGTGKITYKGDSFEGTVKMVMVDQNMEMTSHMTGRRIGDCEKAE